jgi:succinate-acetate transporter protein
LTRDSADFSGRSRRALGALFTFLTLLFALIAVAAYVERVWAIVFAAAVLALWLAGMALRGLRAR